MKDNHRYREFSEAFERQAALFLPWEGDVFRSTSLDYPKPGDLLSGEGSYRWGGRWNAAGSCRAVYGSTTDLTAVAESRAHDAYYGIGRFTKPRLLVAIRFKLERVLDLTDPGSRRKLHVTLREIRGEDWRKLNHGGHESLTQALGRAAAGFRAEALLAPSAAVKGGVNVVHFPANLSKSATARVWSGAELERLPGKNGGPASKPA